MQKHYRYLLLQVGLGSKRYVFLHCLWNEVTAAVDGKTCHSIMHPVGIVLLLCVLGTYSYRHVLQKQARFQRSCMHNDRALTDFLEHVSSHSKERCMMGLSFRKPRMMPEVAPNIKRIDARYVQLQSGLVIQLHYQYRNRDEFKNVPPDGVVAEAARIINQKVFREAVLQTANMYYRLVTKVSPGNNDQTCHLQLSPVRTTRRSSPDPATLHHDRTKKTLLSIEEPFLQLLGVTTTTTLPRLPGHSTGTSRDQSCSPTARPRTGMVDKLRQIEKFSEIVHGLVTQQYGPSITALNGQRGPSSGSNLTMRVVDMGSGLGYLTFAVHTLLRRHFPECHISTVGVEQRGDLVNRTNTVARQLGEGCEGLSFVQSTLQDYIRQRHGEGVVENASMLQRAHRRAATCRDSTFDSSMSGTDAACDCGATATAEPAGDEEAPPTRHSAVDILLALHACDTATDEALWHGVHSGARVIVAAPCCHKELRRQFRSQDWTRGWDTSESRHISTAVVMDSSTIEGEGIAGGDETRSIRCHPLAECLRHGTYEERVAEMVTDTLRALYLQYAGYETKVFEFVPGEHTAKNVLITALKRRRVPTAAEKSRILARIQQLKTAFGVTELHLERLMKLHA